MGHVEAVQPGAQCRVVERAPARLAGTASTPAHARDHPGEVLRSPVTGAGGAPRRGRARAPRGTGAGRGPSRRRARRRCSAHPRATLPATVWGSVHSPGASIQSSTTAHTMSVAPKITRTSPASSAPETIWSHRASTVPPPPRHAVGSPPPFRPPLPCSRRRAAGSRSPPARPAPSASHWVPVRSEPRHMAVPVSMAGTRPNGVVGHGLGRPVAARPGDLVRRPRARIPRRRAWPRPCPPGTPPAPGGGREGRPPAIAVEKARGPRARPARPRR